MGKTEFPTIAELVDTILYTMGYGYSTCTYDQDTHTFHAVELIPVACRDSGGSIDSIDFRPEEHSISFLQAYKWYEGKKQLEEKLQEYVPSAMPCFPIAAKMEDTELPF